MEELKSKLAALASKLSQHGIPIIMIREPKTGLPSISLTMMVISYSIVAIGLIGKYSKMLGEIDLQQSMNLLILTSGLYFGRSLTYKTKDNSETTTNNEGNKNE